MSFVKKYFAYMPHDYLRSVFNYIGDIKEKEMLSLFPREESCLLSRVQ
jgi:hypothetical protein